MFSIAPCSIIQDALPNVSREPRSGARWWIEESSITTDAVKNITQTILSPESISQDNRLKKGNRRLVFKAYENATQPFVVKAFPLKNPKHRFLHKKYAHEEAKNLLLAASRGVPVPKVYAYGEYRKWGLVKWSAVVMEFAPGKTLDEYLMNTDSEASRFSLLEETYGLIKQLYLAGCFHMDFRVDSIHYNDSERQEQKLIDFQYAHFSENPSLQSMALNAGLFAFSVSGWRKWLSPEAMDTWFEGLLRYLEVKETVALWNTFQKTHKRRLGTSEKQALTAGL